MTIKERREREKQEVRELILITAQKLFVELGYEGVTMRTVATRIDYSPTAIYSYFSDKEALFQELCERDFTELLEAVQKLAVIANPLDRLMSCGRAYIEFAVTHPNHYRLMFMTPLNSGASMSRDSEGKSSAIEGAYQFLRSLVHECLEAEFFLPQLADVDLIAQTLWAGVHGVAALEITACKQSGVPWRKLQDRSGLLLQSIMRGMSAGPVSES
jgi:AcrR family transcriptional regulator